MPLRGSRFTRRPSNPLGGRLRELERAVRRPRRHRVSEAEDAPERSEPVTEAVLTKRLAKLEKRLAKVESKDRDGKVEQG